MVIISDKHCTCQLLQELETVKSDLATERSKSTELGSQVAKMNQIISASQEALQQEQKTVELLKEAKVNRQVDSCTEWAAYRS